MEDNEPDHFEMKYLINSKEDRVAIFGEKFVQNNEKRCKMEYMDEIMKIKPYIKICKIHIGNYLKIKLFGIHNVNNISRMFYNCKSLISLKVMILIILL